MNNIVKYLRLSEKYDLTQEELAVALGVSRHTIISIEKGGSTTAEMVIKIGHFFNKDPREIFFIRDVEQSLQNEQLSAI